MAPDSETAGRRNSRILEGTFVRGPFSRQPLPGAPKCGRPAMRDAEIQAEVPGRAVVMDRGIRAAPTNYRQTYHANVRD